MKNWLVLIFTITMLALLIWAMTARANQLAPISKSKSVSVCGTDDRVTYIYPSDNRIIDISVGISPAVDAYLVKNSGEDYHFNELSEVKAWTVNEQYHGEGEYEIRIWNEPNMTRKYVITNDSKYMCDLNKDGTIDLNDFSIIASVWLE